MLDMKFEIRSWKLSLISNIQLPDQPLATPPAIGSRPPDCRQACRARSPLAKAGGQQLKTNFFD